MRLWVALAAASIFSSLGFGQVFEASGSAGWCVFGGSKKLGTATPDPSGPQYEFNNGFHIAGRMTINAYRFIGYEFGYAYNRTSVQIPTVADGAPVQDDSVRVSVHHGFANVLLYALPEGKKIRPFVAGGAHFSSFFPPGASVSYGNQVTKFGFNYGAGVKVWAWENWGFRFDGRFYETSKPFKDSFFNQRGRLRQFELSAGVSFFM